MRIGIDTLFLNGRKQYSLAYFVTAFVDAMVKYSHQHQLVLFTSPTTSQLFKHLPVGAVEMADCPVSNETVMARILFQQTRLPAVVKRQGIDVLCCLADVAPLAAQVPIVLKVNSLHHFTAPGSLGLPRRAYRRIMIGASARRARLVVANSAPTASDIRSLLRVPDERIRLVHEAVDDRFMPCVDRLSLANTLKERFGIVGNYLLFVSALYRYKNADLLIRAYESLVTAGRWTGSLVIAGPDPHGDQHRLEQLAAALGVLDQVTFLGSVPNEHLPSLYCGASVFVYPSSSETFGKPLIEAMRCGTPVVAACLGSIPDIAGGAALLVDPQDIEALADAIIKLLSDDQLRLRLRDAGLKRGQDFSWRNVATGFTQVLEEAAD